MTQDCGKEAARNNKIKCLEWLLEHGVSLSSEFAAKATKFATLRWLCNQDCSIEDNAIKKFNRKSQGS